MPVGLSANPQRFILFTVFYNARAYYPVLAILFLDLGLTLDQFVILNVIWAATIFLFEVPSGALADTIGRRKLLIFAAGLMVLEMLCLLAAPRNGGAVLFAFCVVNRICSGLSEACASGADEALVYDSLPESGRAAAWDHLLARAMRFRSAGFVIAMVLGGVIYDPVPLNRWLPEGWRLSVELAQRLPIWMVLGQALVCLFITWRMVEPPRELRGEVGGTCRRAVRLTLETVRWVFTNPKTLVVVCLGLAIDSVVRNVATINSSYYRFIELPEWTYGFIGAGLGVIGWFVPGLAKQLNARFSTLVNLGIAAVLTFLGLAGLVPGWKFFGVFPAMLLMLVLSFLGFTVSRALHLEAGSERRATVLSVKGLAFNLGYGLFSLGFSRLLASFPAQPVGEALRGALFWQVPVFAGVVLVLFVWGGRLLRRSGGVAR